MKEYLQIEQKNTLKNMFYVNHINGVLHGHETSAEATCDTGGFRFVKVQLYDSELFCR